MRPLVHALVAATGMLVGCTAVLDPASFLGTDAGTEGGLDAGQDGGQDAGDCRCRDPEAVCAVVDGDPVCRRPGEDCGACPTGYACDGGSVCACEDATACGVECASDLECGSGRCHVVERVCRPAVGCLNYNGCPDFGICVELRCVSEEGSVPVGGACRVSDDCFDGFCHEGFCRTPCLFNDSCGGGQVCGYVNGSLTPFCMAPSAACATCTDFESVCSAAGACEPGCEEQIDCDAGECVVTASGYFCRTSTPSCSENEVVIESAGACALPTGCYPADDPACLTGYVCRSEETLGLSDRAEIGFCVRAP